MRVYASIQYQATVGIVSTLIISFPFASRRASPGTSFRLSTSHQLSLHCSHSSSTNDTMSTLVDELLQDFEDSGSENGDVQNDAQLDIDDDLTSSSRVNREDNGDMMLDGDEEGEEEEADGDEEMGGLDDSIVNAMEDQEAAKARVEKMQLGNVNDVRKVTSVMDRLDPLLKVSLPSLYMQ